MKVSTFLSPVWPISAGLFAQQGISTRRTVTYWMLPQYSVDVTGLYQHASCVALLPLSDLDNCTSD